MFEIITNNERELTNKYNILFFKEIKAFIKSLKEDKTEETETEESLKLISSVLFTDENEISENPLFIIKSLLLENKINEAIAYIDSRL